MRLRAEDEARQAAEQAKEAAEQARRARMELEQLLAATQQQGSSRLKTPEPDPEPVPGPKPKPQAEPPQRTAKARVFALGLLVLFCAAWFFRGELAGLFQEQLTQTLPATHVNSLGMEFVLIPAGTFEMGYEEKCDSDEKPRQPVRISRPFYLGKTEVTQAQWEAVMGSNPSHIKGSDRPVERVRWDEVQEFIRKLNAKEGHTRYRLPTEAEWEYAARAGSGTAYSFGDDAGRLGDYAWYDGNSEGETHPVGKKRANAWGLHDMHGNVWEWVQDWYGKRYYKAGAVVDPQGPSAGEYRVYRGGGWDSDARYCRAACRLANLPYSRSWLVGFRLALDVE